MITHCRCYSYEKKSAPIRCLSGLTGEIESHRRRVRCRAFLTSSLFIHLHPVKEKCIYGRVLFPGTHSTAYSTRERERIEAKREKKGDKKGEGEGEENFYCSGKESEREKGWQVIVDHLIWNWYSSSSNYAWTWCTIVIIFGDNIHSHIESNW